MSNKYGLREFNTLLRMYGDTMQGMQDLVLIAQELQRKAQQEPVTPEYVTKQLKKFLKGTHEVYRFVFFVPFHDVPKHINDERLEFFFKWRMTVRR